MLILRVLGPSHFSYLFTALLRKMSRRLGLGWLPTYEPAFHRPWHLQHPSIIDNDRLIETCDRYESIFPYGIAFEPKNTPWWTHWLVAFAVRKTTLDENEICLLYKYKYWRVIPDIDRMQVHHMYVFSEPQLPILNFTRSSETCLQSFCSKNLLQARYIP